jgi:AcrR family transcriptional regulator
METRGNTGTRSGRAREALLDAAEALFAVHGIDAVSDRTIAEYAGTANHSAVGYHFGGRDGLLNALLLRATEGKTAQSVQVFTELTADHGPDVRDVLTAHVTPWIRDFATLPAPARRARFLTQLPTSPALGDLVRDAGFPAFRLGHALERTGVAPEGVPADVLANRARLLDAMMLNAFASYEARLERGDADGDWSTVGGFLIDAGVGLLGAPVTGTADWLSTGQVD